MTGKSLKSGNGIQPVAAFIPFASLALKVFHITIPLKWIALLIGLQTTIVLSFYLNFETSDFFWCFLSIGSYILVTMPFYMKCCNKSVVNVQRSYQEITIENLFRICAKEVFSDYRLSLLSKIPLALQVLVGGSLLYGVFGADWVLHALAGFGIGALALRAYVTVVGHYGYDRSASYFHLDRFQALKIERKRASAEFTLFSIVVVAVAWEVMEGTVHFISPVNVFRVNGEPLWNSCGDLLFAVCGGMIAWYLFTNKLTRRQ
jgi:hypothetical protein